jgi:hypothetical protein
MLKPENPVVSPGAIWTEIESGFHIELKTAIRIRPTRTIRTKSSHRVVYQLGEWEIPGGLQATTD